MSESPQEPETSRAEWIENEDPDSSVFEEDVADALDDDERLPFDVDDARGDDDDERTVPMFEEEDG